MRNISDDHSMEEVMRLAKSPAGQQLISLLQRSDTGALQKAMEQANDGNFTAAQATLQTLLQSAEAQKLLKELGR